MEAVKRERRKGPAPAAPVEEKSRRDEGASVSNDDAVGAGADLPSGPNIGVSAAQESGKAVTAGLGVESGGFEPPGGEGSSGRGAEVKAASQEGDPTLLLIMRRIEAAKRYPKAARTMGVEGTVVVRFKLEPSGQVEEVEVAESSGSRILDRASLETVRDASPLPYKEGWLKVGIVFKIRSR